LRGFSWQRGKAFVIFVDQRTEDLAFFFHATFEAHLFSTSTAFSCESFQAEPSALKPPINRIFWWTAL
jgi:hypothetical protein